jgi:hypothetical protein
MIGIGCVALLVVFVLAVAAIYWRGSRALLAVRYGYALLIVGLGLIKSRRDEIRRPLVGLQDIPS